MGVQRVNEVIDGLVVAFDNTAALDGVVVAKGWQILPEGDLEHVFVASDASSATGTEDIAVATIEWPGMSPTSRTEVGSIDCAVTVWTGDPSAVDATKDRAYAIVGACEDALRANPSLGSSIALQAKIVQTRLRIVQDAEGYAVIIPFTVAYQTSQ